MPVYNSYAPCISTVATLEWQQAAADNVQALGATGVKFNIGNDADMWDEYISTALEWCDLLPSNCRLLCECHPGSVAEQPNVAADAMAEWPEERVGAIVHPLFEAIAPVDDFFSALGPRIVHAHLQIRDENNRMVNLADRPQYVRDIFGRMVEYGFDGSLTVEFVEGTRSANDEPEYLFERACENLEFIRDNWPRG